MSADAWHMVRPGLYQRCVGANLYEIRKIHTSKWRLSCTGESHFTIPVSSLKRAKAMVETDVVRFIPSEAAA